MLEFNPEALRELEKNLKGRDLPNYGTESTDAHLGASSLDKLRDEQGFEPREDAESADIWYTLRITLWQCSEEFWKDTIDKLSLKNLYLLSELLDVNRDDAIRVIGFSKYWELRGHLFIREFTYPGREYKMTEISGPSWLLDIEKANERRRPFAPRLSDRQKGRILGVDGKTVKRWQERMDEAGPPPNDAADRALYFYRIVKPSKKRREPP